jgi:hypothetical protein
MPRNAAPMYLNIIKKYSNYLNIRRPVFNILDVNIDDAFKVSNNPMLVGWNPSMESQEIIDQITALSANPLLQPYCKMIRFSGALIPQTTPPKYCSGALKIVKKYRS